MKVDACVCVCVRCRGVCLYVGWVWVYIYIYIYARGWFICVHRWVPVACTVGRRTRRPWNTVCAVASERGGTECGQHAEVKELLVQDMHATLRIYSFIVPLILQQTCKFGLTYCDVAVRVCRDVSLSHVF